MPNDNHETYGGVDISTYTDDISGSNTFTNEQIESYVLSAGVAPYSTPYKLVVANFTHEQCTGGPNLYSPFYKESNSNILWYDESGLGILEDTNYFWYKHVIYVSKTGNKIASSLKVQNYRNFLEIVTHTWADIRGVVHKTYYPRITTKYGTLGDWHVSTLQPGLLIKNTTDGMLVKSVEQTEPQSYWYWGGPSNVQNGMGGGSLFTRDLNNGTVSNDSYAVPWEPATSDPIRIKEGGSDYTFPVAFVSDHITSVFYGGNPLNLHQGFNTQEDALLFCAFCGLKFEYNETVYKPLANGGVVYGYTNDMSQMSDWDNWRDIGDHLIPVTPPAPGPTPIDSWDVDPETYGWSGGEVSGMVKYYLLTAGEMSSLQTAIASNANWTIDYLNCIVSCFVVPNSGIFFDAPIPTTVKFKLDNATEWDTGVSCNRIQGTKNKSGGTIQIPRLTNTFYDFEPYSDYSVYIPFCGRVPIKGNVCLGHEIKVTYYPDVPTCSLTAVVSCGGATIAIAKGSFGTMTPVTSNGSDRKTAAVIGNVSPIITGIGTVVAGVALENPLIVGAGASQALGGIIGGVKESVQSYAYSVGSTGDSSFFGAGNRCYYYANYPLIDEVVNNSMFGHSVGYLCNTVGKLSNFTGFTICANPHVTFSATAEEREEIERLLSMGVIL